jgi:hypothetical protein
MQRYEKALADLNRAIELDPADALDIASRGDTYRRMERYDEALADFTGWQPGPRRVLVANLVGGRLVVPTYLIAADPDVLVPGGRAKSCRQLGDRGGYCCTDAGPELCSRAPGDVVNRP